MAAGSFFSALMGSYSDILRGKHKEARDREEHAKDSELEVLKEAVRSGRLTQDGLEAAFSRMEELTGEGGKGGKGKKGGFSFKNLIGQFGDVGHKSKTLEQATTERQGGAAPAASQSPARAPSGDVSPGGETPALPSRPRVFKTTEELGQEEIKQQQRTFEQVDKPRLDYEHNLRMQEIEKQYGSKLRPQQKVLGTSVPLPTDTAGNKIDPTKPYTVLYNSQNQAVAAMEEYEKPASARASGPEAKVASLAKDLAAEAEAHGRPISPQEAESQARRLVLAQARAQLAATLETTRGKQFANKVRADLEKGVMTPATARGVIGYVGTEAKRRFSEDMATIATGKSIAEIEDDIYRELGTSRDEVATYLRQGAKPPESKKANKFDPSLNPMPERPSANP